MVTNVWQLLGWLAWVLETGRLAYLNGAHDAEHGEPRENDLDEAREAAVYARGVALEVEYG